MKIAIPTNGDNLDCDICKSFGRAKRFLVVDSETLEFEIIENTQNMQSAQGAGIQSAQLAIRAGGDTIITMHCGPKAYRILAESGVRVFAGSDGSVLKNIQGFNEGILATMNCANKESHWV